MNLIPEYNLLIARGLSFKAQMIVPVYNDFNKDRLAYHDLDEEGSMIRPGLISLTQFLRLDDEVFVTATAGFFDKNRAGANFEMKKYFANEHERRYEAVKKFLDGGRRWVKKVKLNNE